MVTLLISISMELFTCRVTEEMLYLEESIKIIVMTMKGDVFWSFPSSSEVSEPVGAKAEDERDERLVKAGRANVSAACAGTETGPD